MAFVTSQLVQLYRDRPNEGTLSIFTEFSPMADPSFEPEHPGKYAVELGCVVDRGLRESRAVDTESLCVLAGCLVWAIRVDLHILDNGGNLVDATNIAALAALMAFRRPECTLEGDDVQEVTVHPPEGYALVIKRATERSNCSRRSKLQTKYTRSRTRQGQESGSRPESSLLPHFSETRFSAGAYAVSNSFGSPSALSESWESSSKQPPSFMHRNVSSRHSFMSKPVYSLVYQNLVSDSEACGSVDETNCIMLAPNNKRSSMWSESPSSLDPKFHNTLTELQKMEASPDPSMSSRREGFRWSTASSNDMGFDGQNIDMTERLYLKNVRLPHNPTDDQKCGLCGRLLVQKPPWSSYRIVRSGDMPIAGVLPCSHVFHAESLEQKKTQVHDPGPVYQKIGNGAEASSPVLEPLQMALRAVRMNQGVDIEANGEGNGDQLLYQMESRMMRIGAYQYQGKVVIPQ